MACTEVLTGTSADNSIVVPAADNTLSGLKGTNIPLPAQETPAANYIDYGQHELGNSTFVGIALTRNI